MGEYADLSIEETIGSWDGRSSVHYGLSPIALKPRKTCQQCGYPHLYWAKHDGRWKLHHWSLLPGEKKPRFVLHRCGFTSDGKPKPTASPESSREGTGRIERKSNDRHR